MIKYEWKDLIESFFKFIRWNWYERLFDGKLKLTKHRKSVGREGDFLCFFFLGFLLICLHGEELKYYNIWGKDVTWRFGYLNYD